MPKEKNALGGDRPQGEGPIEGFVDISLKSGHKYRKFILACGRVQSSQFDATLVAVEIDNVGDRPRGVYFGISDLSDGLTAVRDAAAQALGKLIADRDDEGLSLPPEYASVGEFVENLFAEESMGMG